MAVKLLFIDEEIPERITAGDPTPYMWYYSNAFGEVKADIDLTVARTVDEAKSYLQQEPCPFNVVSIDVIMPPGEGMSEEEAEAGTSTGILLFRWVIKSGFSGSVVLLTQRAKATIEARLLRIDRGKLKQVRVLEKLNTTPFQLIEIIRDMGDA